MKKRFTLILASMLLTMGAWAQVLNFTFTREGANATVNVDGATGVTATITATSPSPQNNTTTTGIWNTGGNMGTDKNVLCTSTNTSATAEDKPITYTLTISGLTAHQTFNAVTFTSKAVNGSGGYQSADTNSKHYCSFSLTANDAAIETIEQVSIMVNSKAGVTKDVTFNTTDVTADADGKLVLTLKVWTHSDNPGCFYGLTEIEVANYSTLLTNLIEEAQTIYNAHDAKKGTLGYYSTATINALGTAIATANAVTKAAEADITDLQAVIDGLELVVPTRGKFYRLQGKASGWYASASENNSKMALVKDKEADPTATVFYLTENNKLLSFKLGTFLKETHSIGAVDEANGNAISFNPSESGNAGYFTLKTDYSGSKYIYDDKADSEVDRNGNYAANNCEWIVEEVTYLPVPVSNTLKFGTLYSPVALSLTEQWSIGKIKAYTGAVNGDYLELTEIEGDIPANTPVVIEHIGGDYKNGCAFLQIIETAEAVSAKNDLSGTLADEYITPAANENAYVLANKDDVVGFYKAAINVNTDTSNDLTEGEGDEAVTTPVPESFLNNGFKAYLTVESQTQAIRIRKAGDEETTSIEPSTLNPQPSTVIYDLQGRRVEKMEKGIYIVNGRKVIR